MQDLRAHSAQINISLYQTPKEELSPPTIIIASSNTYHQRYTRIYSLSCSATFPSSLVGGLTYPPLVTPYFLKKSSTPTPTTTNTTSDHPVISLGTAVSPWQAAPLASGAPAWGVHLHGFNMGHPSMFLSAPEADYNNPVYLHYPQKYQAPPPHS